MLDMVPRAGVEPARPCGHYALNVARLPFRHLGNLSSMVNDTFQSNPKTSNASRLIIPSISSSGIPGKLWSFANLFNPRNASMLS